MELLQPKSWSRLKALLKVDFYVVRYPLLVLIILSIIACIYPEASRCSAKWEGNEPAVYTKCYRYIQFYPAIFIAFMTGEIFGETFRAEPKEYMHALGLSPVTLLLKRTIFWWSVFLIIEMLPIMVLFSKINASVVSKVPKIPLYIPILHCAIAYASYIAIIQFLLALAKEKAIPITLFMAYCAMESGSFHIIFGSYSVFRGAFNAQDYYHMFPQNIMCMAITMPVLYTVVYFLNKKR